MPFGFGCLDSMTANSWTRNIWSWPVNQWSKCLMSKKPRQGLGMWLGIKCLPSRNKDTSSISGSTPVPPNADPSSSSVIWGNASKSKVQAPQPRTYGIYTHTCVCMCCMHTYTQIHTYSTTIAIKAKWERNIPNDSRLHLLISAPRIPSHWAVALTMWHHLPYVLGLKTNMDLQSMTINWELHRVMSVHMWVLFLNKTKHCYQASLSMWSNVAH